MGECTGESSLLARQKQRKERSMTGPTEDRKCDENEEYRIVDGGAPASMMNMMTMRRIAVEHPEKVIDALGIHDGTYDLGRIDRETSRILHSAVMSYRGRSPTRKELRIIESRASAYNAHNILTPEDIRKTFEERPDIGVIRTAGGILQIFGSIRKNSDIPLSDHGEGWFLVSEDEKAVLRNMMEYRNRVFTSIEVESPSQEEIDSWIRLFMELMARMYTIANGKYTGGN